MPSKKSFKNSFKLEVIAYMASHSSYQAAKFFGRRDNYVYDPSMFRQWFKIKERLFNGCRHDSSRVPGAGRKPKLGDMENILRDEIIEQRIAKQKVTRAQIALRANELAKECGIDLSGSSRFVDGFLARHNFSLRRMTNLTTLTDETLIARAVSYMKYLGSILPTLDLNKTLLMDETAVFFEDCRTNTIDMRGRRHVVLRSTGYSSMRITAVMGVWASGKKAKPLLIHKGKQSNIVIGNGVNSTCQEKAWVNQALIIKYIDAMFPLFDMGKKCIVWDSCRVHIGNEVKSHCRKRGINQIVIPGGLTAYLQAGDLGIYRVFKDKMSNLIDMWKQSSNVELTRGGNPKPPAPEIVRNWVKDAWQGIDDSVISNSIKAAGFDDDYRNWHISKHDVYGSKFNSAWNEEVTVLSDANITIVEEDDTYTIYSD